MVEKYQIARLQAWNDGWDSFEKNIKQPYFKDFLIIYLCEGYKRDRNMVQVTNADPSIIQVCYPFVKTWTKNKINYFVQIHHDDDAKEIVNYWSSLLNITPSLIKTHLRAEKKTNRKGKLPHGIFTFRVGDTYLKCKLDAWISRLKEGWSEWSDLNRQPSGPKPDALPS